MFKWVTISWILFISSCKIPAENGPIIHGKIQHMYNGYIYLDLSTPDGYQRIDSARINSDKTFSLRARKNTADMYRLNFFNKQKTSITLADQDIWIEADGNSFIGRFKGKGSAEIEMISEAHQLVRDFTLRSGSLMEKVKTAQSNHDTVALEDLKTNYENQEANFKNELKQLIRDHDGSLAALLVLSENLAIEPNLDFYQEQIPVFQQKLGNSWYLEKVVSDYQDIKKLAVGSIAPAFGLPDPEGDIIQSSSFKGKYLYLDFWASWCQPCRMENPDLVHVYDKYKGPDFEILGVSFDRKKESWLKAIKADSLEWIHVSDLKYFDSEMIQLYNITNVPTTFLLDPEGRIIAKNIHYNELDAILGEVL